MRAGTNGRRWRFINAPSPFWTLQRETGGFGHSAFPPLSFDAKPSRRVLRFTGAAWNPTKPKRSGLGECARPQQLLLSFNCCCLRLSLSSMSSAVDALDPRPQNSEDRFVATAEGMCGTTALRLRLRLRLAQRRTPSPSR